MLLCLRMLVSMYGGAGSFSSLAAQLPPPSARPFTPLELASPCPVPFLHFLQRAHRVRKGLSLCFLSSSSQWNACLPPSLLCLRTVTHHWHIIGLGKCFVHKWMYLKWSYESLLERSRRLALGSTAFFLWPRVPALFFCDSGPAAGRESGR